MQQPSNVNNCSKESGMHYVDTYMIEKVQPS